MEIDVTVSRSHTDGSVIHFNTKASSIEDAIAISNQLYEGKVTVEKTAEPKSETKKSPAKTASSGNGVEPKTTQKEGAPEPKLPGMSYDEVKTAIINLGAAKGRDMVIATLSRFGVASGKDLKTEQYPYVVEMARAVLSGEIDPRDSLSAPDDLA